MDNNVMDSFQDIANSSQLPRGLITRRGTQRLPSLKSESQSSSKSFLSPNISTNSLANNTTKGGVLKRTFKPTIPIRRNVNGEDINESSKRIRNSDSNTSRKGKQPKSRTKFNDSKSWVQTEGAVFKGESSPHLRSSRIREESVTSHRSSNGDHFGIKSQKCEESSSRVKIESKAENKAKTIRRLYGHNFVDDDDEHLLDTHLVYPKGWQTVSSHRKSLPSNSVPLNPYNLLKTGTHEKLLLMQIPETILKRSDGYIGKMRVYKSGRIEMIDSDSDLKFDILFDRNSNFEQNVKQENDSKYSKPMTTSNLDDITQDVVTFSGSDLCTLTTLDHKQVLMAVPSIPLDNQITTNFFL